MTVDAQGTKQRLLAAAGPLFAARGFAGTSMRDIADRAGVNLAAANYHFGSKKDLYVAVLREQFALVRAELERQRAAVPSTDLARLARAELEALVAARCRAILDVLVGPSATLHGPLMQREFTDPTEALPVVLAEFVGPMFAELAALVRHLEPALDPQAVQRCVFSCVGQVVFYRLAKPAVLGVLGATEYPPDFVAQTAAHINEFSRGGMARLGRQAHATGHRRVAAARRRRSRAQVSHAAQS